MLCSGVVLVGLHNTEEMTLLLVARADAVNGVEACRDVSGNGRGVHMDIPRSLLSSASFFFHSGLSDLGAGLAEICSERNR